ncbi:hypothetical protein BX666DRAFT_1848443, partial [Dichotomocladium elegans]
YIYNVPQDELKDTKGKCLFIDPGRCDILYGMHELSTPGALQNIQEYAQPAGPRNKDGALLANA